MKRWWGRGRSSFPALSVEVTAGLKKRKSRGMETPSGVLLGPLLAAAVLREMMSKTRGSFDLSACRLPRCVTTAPLTADARAVGLNTSIGAFALFSLKFMLHRHLCPKDSTSDQR
jgi:hypothetical protein